jgi:hypothetical protein
MLMGFNSALKGLNKALEIFSFGSQHILLHMDVLLVELRALHYECYSARSN